MIAQSSALTGQAVSDSFLQMKGEKKRAPFIVEHANGCGRSSRDAGDGDRGGKAALFAALAKETLSQREKYPFRIS